MMWALHSVSKRLRTGLSGMVRLGRCHLLLPARGLLPPATSRTKVVVGTTVGPGLFLLPLPPPWRHRISRCSPFFQHLAVKTHREGADVSPINDTNGHAQLALVVQVAQVSHENPPRTEGLDAFWCPALPRSLAIRTLASFVIVPYLDPISVYLLTGHEQSNAPKKAPELRKS